MNSILVVCEGNICRSPMAQGLLAAALPQVPVRSAGLHAWSGMPADETAVRLMRSRGIDIASHRAVQLTGQICVQAELVLVMESRQRQELEESYPFACGRVFRLGELGKYDVPDPYRKSDAAFRTALQLIEQGVQEWLERIRKSSEAHSR